MAKNKAPVPQDGGTDSATSANTGVNSAAPSEVNPDTPSTGANSGTDTAAEATDGTSGPALRSRKRDLGTTSEKFNLVTFAKGTKEELDKIVWPTRQQLISESAAVLLMVSLSATVVYLVDNLFSWAARQVFG